MNLSRPALRPHSIHWSTKNVSNLVQVTTMMMTTMKEQQQKKTTSKFMAAFQPFPETILFLVITLFRWRNSTTTTFVAASNENLKLPTSSSSMNDGEKEIIVASAAEATDDIWNSRMRRFCSQINAKWMSLFHSRPARERNWIDNFRRPGQLNPQTVTTAQKSFICDTFSGRWWKSCPKKHTTPHTQHSLRLTIYFN